MGKGGSLIDKSFCSEENASGISFALVASHLFFWWGLGHANPASARVLIVVYVAEAYITIRRTDHGLTHQLGSP
jgi:hypothetical protein